MPQPPQFLSNEQLIDVLVQSNQAVAVHVTDQFVIQYASDTMISVWGKDRSVIGLPLEKALPELEGQPFIGLFKKVWYEGITISGSDTPADLEVNGQLKTFYFDFEYRPIKNKKGKTFCILHTATDVTERYLSQQRERQLQEEMQAANYELNLANEELQTANEELTESQERLRAINTALLESDTRFRNLVKQAPIGICIVRAKDLWIQDVNDIYLELVGRKRSELENRTIWEAIPEAAEAYAPVMKRVIDTGVPFIAKEIELVLIRHGVPETVFIDFVYEPVMYNDTVDTIMVLVIDTTDKVRARHNIEEMEERIRLAVEAAEIGTYDLNLEKGSILTSPRVDAIYGLEQPASWDQYVEVIHSDDRVKRETAYTEAYKNGKLAYEARVIHKDSSVHWIRTNGKVYYNNGKPVRVLGTVLDITEYKRLQQQKDDFLSIASHELKTPITSLKASLQLLERMKDNPSVKMLPRLVEQANRSMDKISALVEDLLNVSRANESQLKLNKKDFDIVELLENCCNHIRAAGKYQIEISGVKPLIVNADEHAIDQVITNLVNNAVKYAPGSLTIRINITVEDGYAKISVSDSGPGIPEDKLPHLFERYYQVNASGYYNSGLGLGLYICSEIIKKHNGKIGVKSKLGQGSTFYFTLPL